MTFANGTGRKWNAHVKCAPLAAPLKDGFVLTPGNRPPAGGRVAWLTAPDGVRLRAAFWPAPDGAESGGAPVLVLPGRTEFIEKYFEVIGELRALGLGVAILDWRGQGLSDRLLPDPEKGHVGAFADYVMDLRTLTVAAGRYGLKPPFRLLAHSMGGHIALRALSEQAVPAGTAVLSAPMAGIKLPRLVAGVAPPLARVACLLGAGAAYTGKGKGHEVPAAANRLTHDHRRYERTRAVVEAAPALKLNGPTWGWADAAFRSVALAARPERLARISIPVLIVGAEEEMLVDNAAQKRLARLLPKGKRMALRGAYHELLMETDSLRTAFWDLAHPYLAGEAAGRSSFIAHKP